MIRRALRNLLRRQVQLQDDHTTIDLQFVVGRRTVRNSTQITRNDTRGGGFFTRRQAGQPGRGFGRPDTLFDEEFLDIDEEGFIELPDGSHVHVDDPRLTRVLSQFRP